MYSHRVNVNIPIRLRSRLKYAWHRFRLGSYGRALDDRLLREMNHALLIGEVRRINAREWQEVAYRFASRAQAVDGVREIRLTSADDTLLVTVLTEDRDMQRDLRLQTLFVEVIGDLEGGASLRIRPLGYDDSEGDDGDLLSP